LYRKIGKRKGKEVARDDEPGRKKNSRKLLPKSSARSSVAFRVRLLGGKPECEGDLRGELKLLIDV